MAEAEEDGGGRGGSSLSPSSGRARRRARRGRRTRARCSRPPGSAGRLPPSSAAPGSSPAPAPAPGSPSPLHGAAAAAAHSLAHSRQQAWPQGAEATGSSATSRQTRALDVLDRGPRRRSRRSRRRGGRRGSGGGRQPGRLPPPPLRRSRVPRRLGVHDQVRVVHRLAQPDQQVEHVRVVVEERPRRDVLPEGGLGLRVEGLWGRGLGEREGREERRRRKRVSFF